jgi:hypothetical protein
MSVVLSDKFAKELKKFIAWVPTTDYKISDLVDGSSIQWQDVKLDDFEEPGRNKLETYIKGLMKVYFISKDDKEINDIKLLTKDFRENKPKRARKETDTSSEASSSKTKTFKKQKTEEKDKKTEEKDKKTEEKDKTPVEQKTNEKCETQKTKTNQKTNENEKDETPGKITYQVSMFVDMFSKLFGTDGHFQFMIDGKEENNIFDKACTFDSERKEWYIDGKRFVMSFKEVKEVKQKKETKKEQKQEVKQKKETKKEQKQEVNEVKESKGKQKQEVNEVKESKGKQKQEVNEVKESKGKQKQEVNEVKESKGKQKQELNEVNEFAEIVTQKPVEELEIDEAKCTEELVDECIDIELDLIDDENLEINIDDIDFDM